MEVTFGARFSFPNTPLSKYSTRQGSSLQACSPKSTCAWSYHLTTAHIFRSPTTTPQSLMCSIKNKQNNTKYKLITLRFWWGLGQNATQSDEEEISSSRSQHFTLVVFIRVHSVELEFESHCCLLKTFF